RGPWMRAAGKQFSGAVVDRLRKRVVRPEVEAPRKPMRQVYGARMIDALRPRLERCEHRSKTVRGQRSVVEVIERLQRACRSNNCSRYFAGCQVGRQRCQWAARPAGR